MEGSVQHVAKHVSKLNSKIMDDFLEWPSELRVSLLL